MPDKIETLNDYTEELYKLEIEIAELRRRFNAIPTEFLTSSIFAQRAALTKTIREKLALVRKRDHQIKNLRLTFRK